MADSDLDSGSHLALSASPNASGEATAKHQIALIIQDLPDDSSYDEILRELAFFRMVQRGLADVEAGRTTVDAALRRRLRDW